MKNHKGSVLLTEVGESLQYTLPLPTQGLDSESQRPVGVTITRLEARFCLRPKKKKVSPRFFRRKCTEGNEVLWMLKGGIYLDGGGGGAKENIYDCEIWITENHTLTSTASYREGSNAFGSLATLSLTSQLCAGAWHTSQLCAVASVKKP